MSFLGVSGVPGSWRFLASWSLSLGVTGSGGVPGLGSPGGLRGYWGAWDSGGQGGLRVGAPGCIPGGLGDPTSAPQSSQISPSPRPKPPCAGARGPSAAAIIGAEDEDFENDIEPVSVGRGPWGNPPGLPPQILTPCPLPRPPRNRTANSRAWSCCGSIRSPSWPSCSTSCSSSTPAPW